MDLKNIPKIKHNTSNSFFLIAGPCAIEGDKMANRIAEEILNITNKLEIPFIFKGSFKKANRSKLDSFTGIGDEKALAVLKNISDSYNKTATDQKSHYDKTMARTKRNANTIIARQTRENQEELR